MTVSAYRLRPTCRSWSMSSSRRDWLTPSAICTVRLVGDDWGEEPLAPTAWPGIPGPMSPPPEEVLAGGNVNKVVRVGSTVRRTAGPWTPTIHALLAYLDDAGFEASPRPLGMDAEGREVLTYIEGDTVASPVPDAVWIETLGDAARLLRRYHDLSTSFPAPADAVWQSYPADSGAPEVICHSDWGTYNAVWRDGRLVAVIDWDFARPGSRLFDLAWFALMWCPLGPPERYGPEVARLDQPARLRQLVDAYALDDRGGLLRAIQERVETNVEWIEQGAAQGNPIHVKMLAEGHADHYRAVLAHLEIVWDDLSAALA